MRRNKLISKPQLTVSCTIAAKQKSVWYACCPIYLLSEHILLSFNDKPTNYFDSIT